MMETPPPAQGRPISGPSKLVLRLRWGGFGLFVLGFVISFAAYYASASIGPAAHEFIGTIAWFMILGGMLVLLASMILRFFQWRQG
jgi:peptidoglycan/LPS O-acetylase OafA/YrhL